MEDEPLTDPRVGNRRIVLRRIQQNPGGSDGPGRENYPWSQKSCGDATMPLTPGLRKLLHDRPYCTGTAELPTPLSVWNTSISAGCRNSMMTYPPTKIMSR